MTGETKIFIIVFLITFLVPFITIFILEPMYYGHIPPPLLKGTISGKNAMVATSFIGLFLAISFVVAGFSVIIYRSYGRIKRKRRIN